MGVLRQLVGKLTVSHLKDLWASNWKSNSHLRHRCFLKSIWPRPVKFARRALGAGAGCFRQQCYKPCENHNFGATIIMSGIRHYLITGDGILGLSNNFYKHTHAIILSESEKRLSKMLATGMSNIWNRSCVEYIAVIESVLFRTRRHHTSQESGGVSFFIAATAMKQNRNAELPMQVREPQIQTTTVQARQITSEKFLLSVWAVRNFFSTVVSYEKYNFRLFHCVQPTKINTFCTFFRRQWLSSEWVLPQRYVCWRKWHLFMSMRCWSDRQKLWNK